MKDQAPDATATDRTSAVPGDAAAASVALDAPEAGTPATPTPAAAPDTHVYLAHREIIQVLIGLMAGMFLAALDQSIVGTALPTHRLRPRRPSTPVLGGHRLPADLDRVDPAVGQDLRPVRPAADLPGRHRDLPDRLAARRGGRTR